jgi:hypothetical protein
LDKEKDAESQLVKMIEVVMKLDIVTWIKRHFIRDLKTRVVFYWNILLLLGSGIWKLGIGPNNENTPNNSLNSCQIFWLIKLLTNISHCIHMK